jgi:hypothetical protein
MAIKLTPEQKTDLTSYRWELVQAMSSGARQVTHADKTVTFKSQSELKQAIDEIDNLLRGEKKTRIVKVYYKRGV